MRIRTLALLLAFACTMPRESIAQGRPTGHVAALADFFPNHGNAAELRTRLFVEQKLEPSARFRVTLSGFVEGLLAKRPVSPSLDSQSGDDSDIRRAAIARVQDANLQLVTKRLDLLAGFARVAWGKLDEIQPTDVINPLDVSKFFFEGRSEARLSVALLRARLFVTEDTVLEGVYVPAFRRGRFDQLEETTSPFNLAGAVALSPGPPPTLADRKPDFGESQGGVRFSGTAKRIDLSISAYRGYEAFGALQASSAFVVERRYPRFTLVGGDFETVRGEWGLRGEVAAFLEDSFQSSTAAIVSGRSFDAGIGVDRRAGDYRVSGTVLFHHERYDAPLDTAASGRTASDDVSLIASADRSFARERYLVRVFGVYNASESSGFARGITTATLRDNLALEASVGWFIGGGLDLVGRFADTDFVYTRLKYYF